MAGKSPTAKRPRMAAGQRYGRLVSVELVGRDRHNHPVWKFLCDCGNTIDRVAGNIARGATRSCGCLNAEALRKEGRNQTHGKSNSPEYMSWKSMIARCTNPKATGYENYGGRGIMVCERWYSFDVFYADMGDRPPNTSLDRIGNDGNYEPGNCRWADDQQQNSNQRNNRRLIFQGREITLAKAAKEAGMSTQALFQRLKHGWSVESALTVRLQSRSPRSQ